MYKFVEYAIVALCGAQGGVFAVAGYRGSEHLALAALLGTLACLCALYVLDWLSTAEGPHGRPAVPVKVKSKPTPKTERVRASERGRAARR